MINPYKKLEIPQEELLFIYPEPRERLFYDLIDQYKNRYPDFKLIMAYLNKDSALGIDYLLLFKAPTNSGNAIFYDMPHIYNDRSIPGYRYCKREHKLNDFFDEAINLMTRLSENRFYEYLNLALDLSIDKDSELYWRSEDNLTTLLNGLVDLQLRFKRD